MRNLKRALSLTLASVMLLGMMVVGSSAAGYPDVDSNDNAEAIEVLQAVKVMVGDDNGNFNPDDQVNRAQMAVVMALLLDLNYNYYQGADPGFWDVPSWAAPYVAACYANGIVSGYGNGQYGSADSVTAVQAASMMMRALGYFKYQSDYKDGFELSTVSQASKLRLFDGISAKSNEPLTRNDVAQLALNTLQTPIVEPSDKTINVIDGNGNVIATGGQVDYVVVASRQPFAQAIDRVEYSGDGLNQVTGYTVELGEQLYNGKLELRDNDQDDFGRPARTWVYNGSEIGSYAKRELLRQDYTAAVKGKTIYELVGQAPIRDYTLLAYLDGAVNTGIDAKEHLTRSNNGDLSGTGRGVLTEVYLDNDADELYIVSINTWLARASADYNSNSESITLTVYDDFNSSISKRVELEDAPYIVNMKKDDWCLINWNGDVLGGSSDKVVADVFDVEIREDQKVTAFKRGTGEDSTTGSGRVNRVTQMTVNGENFDNNVKAWYKYNTLNEFNANELVNKTYTMFMDQYGYFIGAELYSGKDQYVFITGYDRNGSNISVNTAKASAIFTDGTMQAIDVNAKDTDKNIKNYNDKLFTGDDGVLDSYNELTDCDYVRWSTRTNNLGQDGYEWENMWYKYSLYNGVYTLTPVDEYTKEINTEATDKTINAKKVYLVPTRGHDESLIRDSRSYGEDASVYITVEDGAVDLGRENGITDVTGVYTGAQDVNLVLQTNQWIHAVYDDTYIVAAIVYGDAEGSVRNYAYIRDRANHEQIETVDGSTIHYWDFDAVMNGETVTKTIKSKFTNTVDDLRPGTVQELILDNDGYVTKIKDIEDNRADEGNVDKTYNNEDFVAGVTKLADYEAYQIATTYSDPVPGVNGVDGWILDAPQPAPAIPGAILMSNGRYASTLTFQGNTLHYYGKGEEDIGLPVARDAKAVVYQRINNANTWENYGSVQSAFNVLNDALPTTANPGKQFDGQVIAVLDSNGVAAWVVFIDATPTNSNSGINTGSDSYTDGNVTVTVDRANMTIAAREVDARVLNGNLTITIPVGYNRAYYDVNGLHVEVYVNGRDMGQADYIRDNGTRYIYAMDGLNIRSTDRVDVRITAKDEDVKEEVISTVTMSEPAPKTAYVGGKLTVSATVDGVKNEEMSVTFDKVGEKTVTYPLTAKSGYVFSATKDYSTNGWTAAVSNNGKTLTMSCTVTVSEQPADVVNVPVTVEPGKSQTVTVTPGKTNVFQISGVNNRWYYVSIGDTEGAQLGVNNSLTVRKDIAADAETTVKVFVTIGGTLVPPAEGDTTVDMYWYGEGGNTDRQMGRLNILSTETSYSLRGFGRAARAEGFETVKIEIGEGDTAKTIYYSVNLTTGEIMMFDYDFDKIMDAAIESETGVIDSKKVEDTVDGNVTAFVAETKENEAGEINEINFEIGAPKAPGMPLETTMTQGDLTAKIEWYEEDAEGNLVLSKDTTADPSKTYVPKVVVSVAEDSDKTLASEVTVTTKVADKPEQKDTITIAEGKDSIAVEPEDKPEAVAPPAPPVPNYYKVNVKITPPSTASVKVNDAVIVADGYEEGTKLVLSFTAEGGREIDTVKVNGEEVTLVEGKYTVDAISEDLTVEVATKETAKVGLTLKGNNFITNNALANNLNVYDGDISVISKAEIKDILNVGVTANIPMTPGSKVTIKVGTAVDIWKDTSFQIGDVVVTGSGDGKQLTFTMPETDFTLDSAQLSNDNKVLVVKVFDNITGKLSDGTALTQGDNIVKSGATITLTSNGDGQKVIATKTFVQGNAKSGIYDANQKDEHKNVIGETAKTGGITESMELHAAVGVKLSDGVTGFVNGTSLETESAGTKALAGEPTVSAYVALGTEVVFAQNTSSGQSANLREGDPASFDAFLVNTKGGDGVTKWVAAGKEAVTVYGAYKITLRSGATATYEDKVAAAAPAGRAASAVTNGQCVAAGQVVKASAPTGSAVVEYVQGQLAYNTAYTPDAQNGITGPLDLSAATVVNITTGTLAGWGGTDKCSTLPTDKEEGAGQQPQADRGETEPASTDKKIYVLSGAYVKVAGGSESPMVEKGGVAGPEECDADNNIVFVVNDKEVVVKVDENRSIELAAALVKYISEAQAKKGYIGTVQVNGNKITGTGNHYYLGMVAEQVKDDSKFPNYFNHSVARELKNFLEAMATTNDTSYKHTSFKYDGVEYTYNGDGTSGENFYAADGKTTFVSVVVKDSEAVFGNKTSGYKDGEWTIKLDVDGLPIEFTVVIRSDYADPNTWDTQNDKAISWSSTPAQDESSDEQDENQGG